MQIAQKQVSYGNITSTSKVDKILFHQHIYTESLSDDEFGNSSRRNQLLINQDADLCDDEQSHLYYAETTALQRDFVKETHHAVVHFCRKISNVEVYTPKVLRI